jgi:hypothetical protein
MGLSSDSEIVYQISPTRIPALFPRSYEGSRARFRRNLDKVKQFWPQARLHSYRLEGDEELTIDWIGAQARKRSDRLLVLSLGEHGIEAYVGAAILQVLLDEYLPRLQTERTGLMLVHAINPWGMKYWRRVNQANVDLNRNFSWISRAAADPSTQAGQQKSDPLNPDYASISPFLNPKSELRSRLQGNLHFFSGLARAIAAFGTRRLADAALQGQDHDPQGIYYCGASHQQETRLMIDLFREHFELYDQILHLDMHTGYGPRYQMTLVNSPLDPRSPEWFVEQMHYPLVVRSGSSEFYQIQGDMIDFVYQLVQEEFPDKGLYATAFEFGTLGSSLWGMLRSLRAEILENQVHHYGAYHPRVRDFVAREFRELFFPQEARWQAKAIADARQAIQGILQAEGFFTGREARR